MQTVLTLKATLAASSERGRCIPTVARYLSAKGGQQLLEQSFIISQINRNIKSWVCGCRAECNLRQGLVRSHLSNCKTTGQTKAD